jgi:3'-phosphoadenosine 5'-phosphosulfate sulfotransferase (PAPS reductase)/FAD synthetase
MLKIVSFSGGKDSTAMLLMLLEKGWPVDEIRFFDGGWEFPQMYDHLQEVEEYTGREITRVYPKKSFEHWMLRQRVIARKGPMKGKVHRVGNGWPSPMRRWCTRQKVDALYRGRKDCNWYVGIASDEKDRAFKQSSELLSGKRIYPLIEWGITEAMALEYCYGKGFTWSGLYNHFKRVSCFCCPLKPLAGLRKVRKYYPQLWRQMLEWDKAISVNRGFRDYDTVQDLEQRFAFEDMQIEMFDSEEVTPCPSETINNEQ